MSPLCTHERVNANGIAAISSARACVLITHVCMYEPCAPSPMKVHLACLDRHIAPVQLDSLYCSVWRLEIFVFYCVSGHNTPFRDRCTCPNSRYHALYCVG